MQASKQLKIQSGRSEFRFVIRDSLLVGLALLWSVSGVVSAEQTVKNLRVWHSPDSTRIVFDVSENVDYKAFKLRDPVRLVVDLEQTNLAGKLPDVVKGNRHVSAIRSGSPQNNALRVVFDLKADLNVNSFVLTPNELYGHRLVIDLTDDHPVNKRINPSKSELESETKTEGKGARNISVKPDADKHEEAAPVVQAKSPNTFRPFVIAIDAGHGGDDPGAIGHRGSLEKKVTLSIAKKLYASINQNSRLKAVMVRTGDYYIKLQDRRKKARGLGADIFISIHADAFGKKSANGMSVFALSQRGATSAMAATLAEKENASDLIGGVSLADKDEVLAKVLVDLSMTNTISESVNLGGRVLSELGKHGRLHSKRVEQANFSVLRSPDVPSILVETGFITNPEEERKLRSSKHQARIANAIYKAVNDYFEQTPYASNERYDSPSISNNSDSRVNKVVYGRHTVRKGDSLSSIAARYGIRLRELKRLNKISHNTAMLGVKLKVPVKQLKVPVKQSMASSVSNQTEGRASVPEAVVHQVRGGDSLSKISSKYNVTIRAIKKANNLNRNTLRAGQKLRIPGVTKAAGSVMRKHKVKRGDTLSEIAEFYGSKVVKIKKANKLRSNTVQLGQVLKIPY